MEDWSFLTNVARALVCTVHDPGVRLRDIAAALCITERRAYAIVTDLRTAGLVVKDKAGLVVKDKDGRRNRYRVLAGMAPTYPVNDHERLLAAHWSPPMDRARLHPGPAASQLPGRSSP